ncbi:hypothetical protein GOP47_0000764 [Adiantum capillus-veneris]|uniref:1-alkyl-2-acetylglycerophosphocholine esterase n=1 Tax=Adiantum capillus-veneris TaxID=13818 RepID=A0A9D4ZTD5_ADICA|nr:hypothetical protein GOP47_0000764 [Adiantum capillus-veneris]
MGLPRPLGPYAVGFADFELRRTEGVHGGIATATLLQHNSPDFVMLADAQGAPLIRIFYPTSRANRGSTPLSSASRWMPSIMYTWGYISKLIRPSSSMHRLAIWILTGIVHSCMWPGVLIQAAVATPILTSGDSGDEGRLPVVIFSHGLWACRTTYSALCCDLASHGYIVVVPEHLDGSANMASYADHNGKRKWLQNTFADVPVNQITMHDRAKQLRQRVLEIRKVVDVLESLDRGLLTQNANTVTGTAALDVNMLQTRLDLHFIAISGHSFGGATSIVASGIDKRIKCCLAMDVWWEPIDKMEFEKLAGKVPVLLLNTENFDWTALRDARGIFMKARRDATQDGRPLVTVLKTIKGTSHQDQSDFTMLFPKIMKKLGVAGKLDPFLTKSINSRACLDFLHKHLLPPGTGSPYAVDVLEDAEHLTVEY